MNSEKQVRVRVAELMRAQYKARGIRRGEFAKRLGVTDRTVGYWADGTSTPKAELQAKIEEMFGWRPGSIAAAFAAGLSGAPLDEIEIAPAAAQGSESGPSSADELLARLRRVDEEVQELRRQLDETRQQLAQPGSHPDYSLAAHTVEDSMSERWAAEARFSDGLERPDS